MFNSRPRICQIALCVTLFAIGCKKEEEKCYTCRRGTTVLENVCGFYEESPNRLAPLVNHYRSIGYACTESGSTSRSSSNVTGWEENTQPLVREAENADCRCNDSTRSKQPKYSHR